jgi:hypothetical protein
VLLVRTSEGASGGPRMVAATARWADNGEVDAEAPQGNAESRREVNALVASGKEMSEASAQPLLPAYEGETDYYSDPNWSNWVGDYIRLCDGAVVRDGVQDGYSKSLYRTPCQSGSESSDCWAKGAAGEWFLVPCDCWWCPQGSGCYCITCPGPGCPPTECQPLGCPSNTQECAAVCPSYCCGL